MVGLLSLIVSKPFIPYLFDRNSISDTVSALAFTKTGNDVTDL